MTSIEVVPSIPHRTRLVGEICWSRPIYGAASPAQFRKKMEIEELGIFAIDPARIDHFYPHLAPGTTFAVQGISLGENMEIKGLDTRPRRWRRPDGKLEVIAYPPPPTIAELMGDSESQGRSGA